ncbi:MAG: transcriptional regulator, GntR family with LacI sensor [Herbinix sp.]|jgi:DNA-binding LacI/PurR family transcriptional regulator|nr:transcriptional regulator, GntR family with LacI sensor [Herbinix sp.]
MSENKLLYEKIISYLRQEIHSQNFKPGDKLPTEKELAQKFGVSRITSKRALEDLKSEGLIYRVRGSGSFVSSLEKNLDKFLSTSTTNNRLDYSRVVPIVLPFDVSNGGIMNVVIGASRVMDEKGYILSIHCCNDDINEEKKLLLHLYEKNVAGIIHYPISDRKNLEVMNLLYLNNYPIVTIDKYYESIPISYVVSDNLRGSYEAVQYLISKGHKKIAFVSDGKIEDATSIRNRYFGYCKALNENKISIDEQLVKSGIIDLNSNQDGIEMYKNLVKELVNQNVTGICAINDYVASSLMKSATELGISVPNELSVIGFDNLEFGKYLSVPLTTVQQNFYKIGKVAAQMLLEGIEGGEHKCFKSVVPTKLIERDSCSKALTIQNI